VTLKRIIIAQESDLHGGNKLGLMNPDVILEDIQKNGDARLWHPNVTESQRELWLLRQDNIRRLIELAGDDPIHYIQDGDPTQGDKHKAELVSERMADQIKIAVENVKPIMALDNLKSARFAAGTGAHNFGQASADILMVNQLKALYPTQDIDVCYHGLAHYGEFVVDFAHHGPYTGSREWLKGNVARYYLQSMMFHAIKHGQKPPDLVIRGHYHTPVVETVCLNGFTSHVIVSPSMCMVDDFAHQAAKSPDDVVCGMNVFEIVNDKLLEVHQFYKVFDTRTEYYFN
jgi:hypothetical protein